MGVLRNGTTGNDTLTGLAAGDTLAGGLGNDSYVVNFADIAIQESLLAGTDTIKTSYLDEAGVYSLRSTSYVENLTYTGTLAASLQGNSLANAITGNLGNDTIAGGAGNDSLVGGAGDDLLSGGAGDDLLSGGTNTTVGDTMIGGAGNDTYLASAYDQMLEGVGQGFDTIKSTGAVKSLNAGKFVNFEGLVYTGTAAATLSGNASANAVTSTSATADTLFGLAGDDTLDGGAGNDSMTGGTGNDTYIVNAGDKVYEIAGDGIDTVRGTIVSINTTTAGANFATTVENLTYTGATGATLTGNAMNNVIIGGSGNDTITAGSGNDIVTGNGGSDSLLGGTGVDFLDGHEVGAAAADTLVGGTGNDRYLIADRLDRVSEGADSIDGGNDWIFSSIDIKLGNAKYANVNHLALLNDAWLGEGNAASNVIVGNAGSNHLAGLAGNDILVSAGSAQQEYVDGTAVELGSPLYDYYDSHDVLEGGDGNDVLIGTAVYYSNTSGSALLGGSGNDTYVIRSAIDTVSDSAGSDTVISLLSNLSIEDYEGIENAKLADSTMISELSSLVTRLTAAGVSSTFAFNFSGSGNLTGNDLANTLTGNSGANILDGGMGNDTLIGGDGNDTLIGGDGTDSLAGGNGNDIYDIAAGDVISETLTGGTDAIRSATITSLAAYANVEGLLYSGTSAVTLAGTAGADWRGGGSGNDTLTGLAGNDTLSGGAGADSIDGGADNDSLTGELGNDSIDGGLGGDQVYGGLGSDSLRGGDGSDAIYADKSPSDYSGAQDAATDVNRLFGDAGNDTLYGAAGADTLDGGADADTLYGKGGNDSLLGGAGDDQLYGGQYSSSDTQTGNDTLNGGAGNDTVYGGDGNDLLQADGTALSTLNYSRSGDVLFGGDGSDTFRLTEAHATTDSFGTPYFSTGHLIADFASGSDKLSILKALVGNGDTVLSSATAIAGTASTPPATTFSHVAELVVFSGNVGLDFSYYDTNGINISNATSVATAIGSADASFALGDKRLFVINDGSDSALFQFVSAGADGAVSAAELKLIGVIAHDASLLASDFALA